MLRLLHLLALFLWGQMFSVLLQAQVERRLR